LLDLVKGLEVKLMQKDTRVAALQSEISIVNNNIESLEGKLREKEAFILSQSNQINVMRASHGPEVQHHRNPIMMAERLRLLAGFETMMIAHHTHPDALRKLVAILTDMTVEVVEYCSGLGCLDAFMTIQDWGLQDRLQIPPTAFREFYLPHYRRVAEVCHAHGLKYFWHCCGWIVDIIPDMIAIGVDAVQLDQPQAMGHQRLADEFGGRIAFWNAVDIQWLTQPGTPRSEADLRTEVRRMVAPFQRFGGGFMLRQYIAPESLQIPPSVMEILYQAFVEYR